MIGKRRQNKRINDIWYIECPGCNKYKTVEEFSKDYKGFLGLCTICKICKRYDLIRRRYNLSREDVEKLLKFQNDKCAICKSLFAGPLDIDHDHKTNRARGMVCRSCNHIILHNESKSNPPKHIKQYLDNPPARCLEKPVVLELIEGKKEPK